MEILQNHVSDKPVFGSFDDGYRISDPALQKNFSNLMSEEEALAHIFDTWSGSFDAQMQKSLNAFQNFKDTANPNDLDQAVDHIQNSKAADEFNALVTSTSLPGGTVAQTTTTAASSASGTFVSQSAGYSNSLYTYDIGADGNPTNIRPLILNSKQVGSGGALNEISITDGKPNLLLLANGASFVNANSTLLFKNGELLINGKAYTGAHYFSTFDNGRNQFKMTPVGDGEMKVEIEDLPNLGDRDFNDLVILVGKANVGSVDDSGETEPPPVVPGPTPTDGVFIDPSAFASSTSLSELPVGLYNVEDGKIVDATTSKFVGYSSAIADGEYKVNSDGIFRLHNGPASTNWFSAKASTGQYQTGLDISGNLYSQEDLSRAGVDNSFVSSFSLSKDNEVLAKNISIENGQVYIDEGFGPELIGTSFSPDGNYRLNNGSIQRQFIQSGTNEAHWINIDKSGLFAISTDYSYEKMTGPASEGGLEIPSDEIYVPFVSVGKLAEVQQVVSVDSKGLVKIDGKVQFSSSLAAGEYFTNNSMIYRKHGDLFLQIDQYTNNFVPNGEGFNLNSSGQIENTKTYSAQELVSLGVEKTQIESINSIFDSVPNGTYLSVLENGEVYTESGTQFMGTATWIPEGNFYKANNDQIYREVGEGVWARTSSQQFLTQQFVINQPSWNGVGFGPVLTYDTLVNDFGVSPSAISLEFISASKLVPNVEYQIDDKGLIRLNGLVIGESFFESLSSTIKNDGNGNLLRLHEGEWLKANSVTGNFELTADNNYNSLIAKGILPEQIELPYVLIHRMEAGNTYSVLDGVLYIDDQPAASIDFPNGRYFVQDSENIYQEFSLPDNSKTWIPIHNIFGKYLVNTPGLSGESFSFNDLLSLGISPDSMIEVTKLATESA